MGVGKTPPSVAPLLSVKGLTKRFERAGGFMRKGNDFEAVSDVSFDVAQGEIVGLLGESGCGKTTLARMIMHLIRPSAGTIELDGREVQAMSEREFRPLRSMVQMVYQNPFDCLDPSRRVASLLQEPLRLWHPELSADQRGERIRGLLEECGLDESCLNKRPAEFSGGQLQRLSVARSLLVRPRLLIADEIVSALDVPIQNQILKMLLAMKAEYHFSMVFITHDLSVARKISDRVMVMNQGRIVGMGAPEDVLDHATDPYIAKLAESVFTFDGLS